MVKKINQEQFSEVLNSPYALVDFSATWCQPCKMLAPIIERLSDSYDGKINFYNIDIDENNEIAASYRIQSIPYVLILKDGTPVSSSIGFKPEIAMKQWIDEALTK